MSMIASMQTTACASISERDIAYFRRIAETVQRNLDRKDT